ncbi:5-formyltetrahydrofolate cyclo-ligase, partial [Bifidobacterium adolescentis]
RNADGSINTHRPQEPENAAEGPEVLTSAELIIVPAFAVDEHGFRLGRGGGWYDRALEHRSSTARVVAVCWPWEPTDETVPHEPHDIPVDGVLTPDGYADVRG